MDEMTFENAMEKLEEIIKSLEKGELTLEQSLIVYENGMKLSAFCNDKLKVAKLKIEELNK